MAIPQPRNDNSNIKLLIACSEAADLFDMWEGGIGYGKMVAMPSLGEESLRRKLSENHDINVAYIDAPTPETAASLTKLIRQIAGEKVLVVVERNILGSVLDDLDEQVKPYLAKETVSFNSMTHSCFRDFPQFLQRELKKLATTVGRPN